MAEAAAEQVDQLPTDRQTDTQTAVFAGHGAIQLLEALIQAHVRRRLEAHTAVYHLDAQRQVVGAVTHPTDPELNRAMAGELDRIVEQATQALRQLAGVPFQGI